MKSVIGAARDIPPANDGDVTVYESPELKGTTWFQRSRMAIFVNGMLNSNTSHKVAAQALSTLQACPMTGVFNQTDGFWTDLGQCITDKLKFAMTTGELLKNFDDWARVADRAFQERKKENPGLTKDGFVENMIAKNKATVSLFRLLREPGYNLPYTRIFAHSQGNLITSNALAAVALVDGLPAIKGRLVSSFGSPCRYWPPGIQRTDMSFTFDPVGWMNYKFSFQNVKVGVAGHAFLGYMAHDPEFVVNRFRWGSLGFTASMDEEGLANALVEMGVNPPRLKSVFQRLWDAHSSDADDVALLYVTKLRTSGRERVLRDLAQADPSLIRLLVTCLVGGVAWRTTREQEQAQFLESLVSK